MNRSVFALFVLAFFVVFSIGMGCTYAQGEDEGDSSGVSAEHPEHPAPAPEPLTVEDVARAVEQFVAGDADLKGGYFLVYDDVDKTALVLSLQKIHKDRLSKVGEEDGKAVYFVCADFVTPLDKVYDLDMFMVGSTYDELTITEITVHKEEGVARYTWYEEDGIWKTKQVD